MYCFIIYISHPLTKNFISQLIANTVHSEIVFYPMLQIVECEKEFVFGNYQDSQKYKFCKLTLVDGDNHIIHCRLSVHLSNAYNHLKKGMIKILDWYTPLRYRVNDVSQLIPALFVPKLTLFGHNYLFEEIYKFPFLWVINVLTMIQSLKLQQKVFFKLRMRITKLWIMDSRTSPSVIILSEYVQSTTSISLHALLIVFTLQIWVLNFLQINAMFGW